MVNNKPSAIRLGGWLLAALLAMVLLWMLSRGFARLGAGGAPPAPGAPPPVATAARTVTEGHLFGESTAPADAIAATTLRGVRLKGVYAPRFAIFSNGNLPDIGVTVGGEIHPGATLQSVYADHVLIMRGGSIERMDLSRSKISGAGTAPRPAAVAVPGGVALSRRELAPMRNDPRQALGLAQLGSYPSAGIVINDATPGSLAARLGLRQGDIVQKINDRPLAGKDDLLRMAEASTAGAQVSIEITRNGQVLRNTYTLEP
jgi:type II secretory pathway component PulC